jgi:wobble nucleotide-excising tRNase
VSQTSISKLGRVTGLGLFRDCPAADHPEFRQYNLIYGFNGSGKTTLSRIFVSLGSGVRSPQLPEEGSFEVLLSDGTKLTSEGDLTALMGRVLVFNTDFIEENFVWKKGEARPVFFIGKEQADLAGNLAA